MYSGRTGRAQETQRKTKAHLLSGMGCGGKGGWELECGWDILGINGRNAAVARKWKNKGGGGEELIELLLGADNAKS